MILFFFFNDTATTEIYTLSLHDALPISGVDWVINMWGFGTLTPYAAWAATGRPLDAGHGIVLLAFCPLFAALYPRSEEHTSELQSRPHLVCRLLLEKKKPNMILCIVQLW